MSRIVHFEIHASNPRILMEFYQQLFGWKFNRWGELEYWLIETGPESEPGINGGLLKRPPCEGGWTQWTNAFICTAEIGNIDASLAKAVELGAEIAHPKMAIPGVGWYAYFKDPDGNLFGLMQPDENAVFEGEG